MKRDHYPKYKATGIDLVPRIPEHWDVKKMKYVAKITTGSKDTENREDDGQYPFFVRSDTIEKISSYSFDGEGILTAGDGVGAAKVFHHYTGKFDFHQRVYLIYDFNRQINGSYLFHYLKEYFQKEVLQSSINTTVDSLRRPMFLNFPLIMPPHKEQVVIATFLDQKTSQIDNLIVQKEQLHKLLEEKRIALITKAVTKGLNPNVKMKPSDIDWLGDIPEHWEVKKLKSILSDKLKYGANEEAEFDDPAWPRYIRITDFNDNGDLREDTFRSLPEEVAEPYLLEDGDILLARSGATVGKSFIYYSKFGKAAYAGYLIRARAKEGYSAKYLYHFFQSKAYWDWIKSIFIQATIQNVSGEKYANLEIPFPSISEQISIVTFLEKELKKIEELSINVIAAIEKLKEYRISLITSAVTGKIDVRDLVQEKENEEIH